MICFVSTGMSFPEILPEVAGHEKAPAKGMPVLRKRASASYRRAIEARADAGGRRRCFIASRITMASTTLVPVSEGWDVVVVGAGPAGLSAAYESASRGARTLVLERAEHPRYKTCGGGLIGPSLAAIGGRIEVPAADRIDR